MCSLLHWWRWMGDAQTETYMKSDWRKMKCLKTCRILLFSNVSYHYCQTCWDAHSYERKENSVFFFYLNWTSVYSLSDGNIPTTDFEHKVLFWQMLTLTIPTVHCTAYSHPVSYCALRTNYASPTQASKHVVSFEFPSHQT